MQLGPVPVSVLWAPAALSAPATPQNWLGLQTWCLTCRSTASWNRPTSRACRAEAASETHDSLLCLSLSHQRNIVFEAHQRITCCFTSLSSSHPPPAAVISRSFTYLWMGTRSWSGIWRGFIIQINQSDNHFSNNNCVINLDIFLWSTWFRIRPSEPYCDWLMMLMSPCVLS